MLVALKKSTKVRNNKINQMKNNKISVFKDLFKSTDVPFNLTLEDIVSRIKNGTSKEKVELIRKGNKEVKKKLPSIIFSGEFTERNRKGLKKHSGLMVLDFDKYPSTKTLQEHLELLKSNKHFVLLFISVFLAPHTCNSKSIRKE